MSIFKGCATALITPFKDSKVDFDAFGEQIEFQLKNKIDALVVLGTTGEASTMDLDEKLDCVRFVIEKAGAKVPIIVGTGGNNTRAVIDFSKRVDEMGVEGLLVVTPYYNKTSQNGLVAHYGAVAEAVKSPIIVYNVPGRTGVNVLPKTMWELADKYKNIVAIKEASGNIEQVGLLASRAQGNFDIYSGNDDQVLALLALGGAGVISTVSNIIPDDMRSLCAAFFDGDIVRARALQFKLLPIFKAAFVEVNPIPIKTMLNLVGMRGGELRLPLIPPSLENESAIRDALLSYGFKVEA